MKKIAVILLSLLFPGMVFAGIKYFSRSASFSGEVDVSGAFNATGPVGIGTLAPAATLHVVGNSLRANAFTVGNDTTTAILNVSTTGAVSINGSGLSIGGGTSLIQSTQPVMGIGAGSAQMMQIYTTSVTFNDPAFVVATSSVGIGTTAPIGPLHVVQSAFTPGSLSGPAAFVQTTGANNSANDVNAAFYSFLRENGSVTTSGSAGHNLGGVMRASDSANSATYTIGGEGRADAYGKATVYVGHLGMALGTYATGSTTTLVGLYARAQMTTNGVTAISSGTLYALYIENVVGGASGTNYALYQAGSDDLNYYTGKIGQGAFANNPTDNLTISDNGSPTISITSLNPTMQSKWQNLSTSSVTWWGTTTAQRIGLYTTSQERVSVSTNGWVGIGNTNPVSTMSVVGRFSVGKSTDTPISRHFSVTASLDFAATAAGTCDSLTISAPGVIDGDSVYFGIPTALAASDTYQTFYGYVSAADVVTLKRCNFTNLTTALSNPAAATVRVDVWQH